MMTKMERGGGKEKGERRLAKKERKPHHMHLSGDHMPLLPPHPTPPQSPSPGSPSALLLLSPPPVKPSGLWVSVPGSSVERSPGQKVSAL